MSYACFICGIDIRCGQSEREWDQQFRILYSIYPDIKDTVCSDIGTTVPPDAYIAHISGVGINFDNSWQVPLNEHMRWDDDSYVPQESDKVTVMRETPVEGRHGYVLHDACWHLLRAALDPQPVQLGRLFHLCESLPISRWGNWLCWGHNYGGVLILHAQDHLPGGDGLRHILDGTHIPQQAWIDPYNVPEVSQLLALQREETESQVLRLSWENRDCFARMPLEIREAIAVVTPTIDALNLGLASHSFTNIMTSQIFWASRFAFSKERGFLFETRTSKQVTDWKQLYRSTAKHCAPLGLQNRIRIWDLILSIKELLELHPESVESREIRTCQLQDNKDPDWQYKQVMGNIKEEQNENGFYNFFNGCRALCKARAVIPSSLSHIAFSIIQAGEVDYIAGLRLISTKDGDQQIGFWAKVKEQSFAVTAATLRGFNVAVCSRGIRALQVVCKDGIQSPWFGHPQDTPITERLVCATQIMALEAQFDGYKLVTLAVAEAQTDLDSPKLSSDLLNLPEQSLRAIALWSPTVPPQGLYLNDTSFVSVSRLMSGYRPMPWILFGGSKGEHLPYLTGVSISYLERVDNIRFHYNGNGLQYQDISFGFCPYMGFGRNFGHQHFPIDGKGGERIIAFAVGGLGNNEFICMDRRPFSFEITTNRRRSFHFHGLSIKPWYNPLRTVLNNLSIIPGTTIIGLFTCQHPEEANIGFGVISAKVEE